MGEIGNEVWVFFFGVIYGYWEVWESAKAVNGVGEKQISDCDWERVFHGAGTKSLGVAEQSYNDDVGFYGYG